MELLLIRHALPVRLEVEHGPADPPLSALGRHQADALAAWLASEPIDALVTSPLRRARETAEPLRRALGLVPQVIDDVAEWDRSLTRYVPTEELRKESPDVWGALTGGDWDLLGIDLPAFLHRVITALDALAAGHPGQRVAVVCHGGVINAYVARVLGTDRVLFFDPGYTSISRVLVARDGTRSIHTLNETAHLRGMADR